MKKIILLLLVLFFIFFLDHLNVGVSSAEHSNTDNIQIKILEEKIKKLEKEMYLKDLTQYIEFQSEVVLPNYFDDKYIEFTYNLANKLQIPERIAFRLIFKESNYIDTAISSAGANGLMQLLPETRQMYYELLRVDTLNYDKNEEDIFIGLTYLKDLYSFWRKKGNSDKYSWKLGLASYNAGMGKVKKYQGIPPYKETENFVTFISKLHSNPQFIYNYTKKYENKIKIGT